MEVAIARHRLSVVVLHLAVLVARSVAHRMPRITPALPDAPLDGEALMQTEVAMAGLQNEAMMHLSQ